MRRISLFKKRSIRRQVLDCASPLALLEVDDLSDVSKAAEDCRTPKRWRDAAHTLRVHAERPTHAARVVHGWSHQPFFA